MSIKIIEGFLEKNNGKYAIIASRWNDFLVDNLIKGAVDQLTRHGVPEKSITIIRCPGAMELPLVGEKIAKLGKFDAIIVLGAIIRGDSSHFDYVANGCYNGLNKVSLEHKLPVIISVLTVDNIEQAIERSGTTVGNKGAEGAMAAIEMFSLMNNIQAIK